MKRLLNVAGSLVGLILVVTMIVMLISSMRAIQSGEIQVESAQSSLSTPSQKTEPTPVPIVETQSVEEIFRSPVMPTPTLAPMSAKATVAALGSQHKSEATPRPLTPIKSEQDVVNVVLDDPLFQRYLDDPMFGPNSKDATPGKPITVRLISKQYFGINYYIVPFYKDGNVSGLATVWVENGEGGMGMWSNTQTKQFPFVDANEAIKRVKEMKVTVTGEPELVFRPTIEGGGDWTSPFWEVKTKENITFYVMYILNETKVYRSDEVHPVD